MSDYSKLIENLDPKNLKLDEPLSKHTTVGIGGPADIWYEPTTKDELINAYKIATQESIPITLLGRGSNVLISDRGIRGIVIRNASRNIQIDEQQIIEENIKLEEETDKIAARWMSATTEEGGRTMYEFKDLNYSENEAPRIKVKMESGVDMPFAINFLINKGITGLQWYARIPGNLGGWIYNNVHGGSHFINEVIQDVTILDKDLNIKVLTSKELGFDYDVSRFHKTQELIIEATLLLYKGDKEKAKYASIEWAKRKAIQASKSFGSTFANISEEQRTSLNLPLSSIGYLIEHVLKLSNLRIGDAAISSQHHNFIENKGNATSKEYLEVIKIIQKEAQEKFGFKFTPEIFFLGFNQEELVDVYPN